MRVSVHKFRDDPMFPRIERVVAELLAKSGVVAPVDVLVGMGLLRPELLNNWRRGRVPYLERVINCNLTRLSRLLRILRFHAHDLNLKPSATVYKRYGKGPKQLLRFSKTGDAGLEAAYATHFVWPGKRPFHSARTKPVPPHQLPVTADGDMRQARKTSALQQFRQLSEVLDTEPPIRPTPVFDPFRASARCGVSRRNIGSN